MFLSDPTPALPFVVGLIAALALTPLARVLAVRTGDIDRPVGLKIHTRPTPLMGGLAVYLAFALACVVGVPLDHAAVRGILLGGAIAVFVGLADEFLNLPPLVHLAGHVLAAVATIVGGVSVISTLSVPTGGLYHPGLRIPIVVGVVLTIVWLVGMINVVNFLDGLDGLASGLVGIAVLFLAAWEADPARFGLPVEAHHANVDLLLPLALGGALIGFLPYNWNPASIFLGDSGSMFLGLAVGAMAIVGPAKLATTLLLLLIPVLDVAWAIVRRQLRGRSFLAGDKQHVYHRMLELGMTHTTTVLLFYGICVALGVIDLLLVKQWKLLAFAVLAILTGAVFIYLEVKASRQGRADKKLNVEAPAAATGSRD